MLLPKKWLLLAFCLVVSGCVHKPQTAPPAAPVEAKPPFHIVGLCGFPDTTNGAASMFGYLTLGQPPGRENGFRGTGKPLAVIAAEGHWAATGAPAKPVPPPPHKTTQTTVGFTPPRSCHHRPGARN